MTDRVQADRVAGVARSDPPARWGLLAVDPSHPPVTTIRTTL